MPLHPGTRLGPYEVTAQIGVGGMGEVYRATDTNLKRSVALKVLPESVAGDPDRLARFQREAEVLAALNHTNIAHIHGLEKSGGITSLVMELVEGPTIADRIASGPIALEEALPTAIQIAEALEAAHALGIIHRDLKPANIKVRSDGVVKVLDFGLAKALEPASALSRAAIDSPTITSPAMMTRTGVILGTAAYMSPEQAKGRTMDTRSDVWSFGCVLFEMLTGKTAFRGDTVTETLAAVIRAEPEWSQLPADTPPLVRSLLRRCLQKDLRQRVQAIGDARITLEEALTGAADAPVAAVRREAAWRPFVPWALLGATVLAFAGLAWVREGQRTTAIPAQPVRLQIPMPSKPPLRVSGLFALSPDGQQLAFAASSSDGIPRIWLRPLSSLEIRPLAGTEGVATLLFWSPDSRFIAFDSGGRLQKIGVSGGPADTVCALPRTPVGGSWNNAGVIIFGQFGGPIMQVPAAGGTATPLTVLDAAHGDVAHNVPVFLPDDRHFIYFRDTGTDGAISAGSLDAKPDGQDTRRFSVTMFGAAYLPLADSNSGLLLYLRRGTLMAQPFDARRLEPSGDPAPVVEGPIGNFYDYGLFSTSRNGTLTYWSPGAVQSQLTWFDAQGNVVSTIGEPGPYGDVALSPDGARAFLSKRQQLEEGAAAVWLLDMSRGTSTRFELDRNAYSETAIWSPDGHKVIFGSARTGQMMDLYQKPISGSADAELLVTSRDWKTPLSWSPDGRSVLYESVGGMTKGDLWVLPLGNHRAPVSFLQTGFDERDGEFSPDGRWVAYASNESGRDEVYVRPFSSDASGTPLPDSGGKWIISSEGGVRPKWKKDGTELYYLDLGGRLMAASVSTRPVFQAGVPSLLFQTRSGSADAHWAPSPDGRRFLFLVPETQGAAPFTVVLNWPAVLRK
jgi:Tol biopolymer transport system component